MSAETRERIVRAAATLLAERGRSAVTTRSVSNAAEVQPPTIYRLFGDMQGLLEAVAAVGFTDYLTRKTAQAPSGDPVDDLRAGWNLHVRFGLENPAVYTLMYGQPSPGSTSDAAKEAERLLHGLVRRVAEAGRLAIDVERAAEMLHAAGMGVTLYLLATAPENRDLTLSTQMREVIISTITTGSDTTVPDGREPARHAAALREVLDTTPAELSPGERTLFEEILTRLARAAR